MLAGGSLTKRFGATLAVDDVSLAVAPGETLALIGRSGSGLREVVGVLDHRGRVGDRGLKPGGKIDGLELAVGGIHIGHVGEAGVDCPLGELPDDSGDVGLPSGDVVQDRRLLRPSEAGEDLPGV